MTDTVQAPYYVTKAEDLDKLPVNSSVVVEEDPNGDHVTWSVTDDVLNYKDSPAEEAPKRAWASIHYKNEMDSVDLLNLSHYEDSRVLVVYVHPRK